MLEEEISRSQFLERYNSNVLLDLCYVASDAPVDDEGVVQRGSLAKVMTRELQLLWGDLLGSLLSEDEADLDRRSLAVRQFRDDILRVWTKPVNMTINKHQVGTGARDWMPLASRSSLASKVNRMLRETLAPGKWHRIQEGYDAWLRVEETEIAGGELVPQIHLAMRYTLPDQIGVKLTDVRLQKTLVARGKKYGATARSAWRPWRARWSRIQSRRRSGWRASWSPGWWLVFRVFRFACDTGAMRCEEAQATKSSISPRFFSFFGIAHGRPCWPRGAASRPSANQAKGAERRACLRRGRRGAKGPEGPRENAPRRGAGGGKKDAVARCRRVSNGRAGTTNLRACAAAGPSGA